MSIDYTVYTLGELLETYDSIDKESYPERYQQLCYEIEKRRENGEFEQREQEVDVFDKNLEFNRNEFIVDFSPEGEGTFRTLFTAAIFAVIAFLLFQIIPHYFVTDLEDIHEYNTDIDVAICNIEKVDDTETDDVYTYYDLSITSFEKSYVALDINKERCEQLANKLKASPNVSIWQKDGLIFQLTSKDSMLLPYEYMKPKIREWQTKSTNFFWALLLVVVVFFFKSVTNALFPGTFKTKYAENSD